MQFWEKGSGGGSPFSMFSACSIIEIALHDQVLITQWDNFDMGFHLRKRTVRCQLLTVTVYHCQLISVICKMGSAGMQRWPNNAMLKKIFREGYFHVGDHCRFY